MNPILTHLITFIGGGTITYFVSRLLVKAKNRDVKKQKNKKYQKVKSKMPKLIKDMKDDLKIPSLTSCREFFISTGGGTINRTRETFIYDEADYDNLRSKIHILEQEDLVRDITPGKTPKFIFNEEFVDMLNADKD